MGNVIFMDKEPGPKQQRETLMQDLNQRLNTILTDMKEQQVRAKKPYPGLTFFASAPLPDGAEEGEDAAPFMVLRNEGEGFWACCKMSVGVEYVGPFDLLLDSGDWTGGYSVLLEAWNVLILHEEDIGGEFFANVSQEWIARAQRLSQAYLRDGIVPEDLVEFCGSPMDEADDRWEFQAQEAEIVERVRLRYHEGWKEEKSPVREILPESLTDKAVAFFRSFLIPLFQPALTTETRAVNLDQSQAHILMTTEESGMFEVTVEQDRDQVYLRIYPDEGGIRPEQILVRGEKTEGIDKGDCTEVLLGTYGLMSREMPIEIRAKDKTYCFDLAFDEEKR